MASDDYIDPVIDLVISQWSDDALQNPGLDNQAGLPV